MQLSFYGCSSKTIELCIFKMLGGNKWTRTTDLTLIRRVL